MCWHIDHPSLNPPTSAAPPPEIRIATWNARSLLGAATDSSPKIGLGRQLLKTVDVLLIQEAHSTQSRGKMLESWLGSSFVIFSSHLEPGSGGVLTIVRASKCKEWGLPVRCELVEGRMLGIHFCIGISILNVHLDCGLQDQDLNDWHSKIGQFVGNTFKRRVYVGGGLELCDGPH